MDERRSCRDRAALCTGTATGARQAPAKVDFATQVQPIFRQYCYDCHGAKEQKNGFRLDRRKDAFLGGTIAVIGPGNSDGSRLYHKLIGDKFGPQMPPTGALPPAHVATIKRWIDEGAEWPDALSGEAPPVPPDPAASAMLEALRAGDRARFDSLLAADASALNKKGPGGKTPLMYAVLYGDAATVRRLLERGADPEHRRRIRRDAADVGGHGSREDASARRAWRRRQRSLRRTAARRC